MIGVYCPTLGRPHSLQRFVENVHRNTISPHRIIFVTEPSDPESYEAALATGETVLVNKFPQESYSNSIQTAYEADDSPYFIAANDDFDFQPEWDVEALKTMREAPWLRVIGLHDGSPACEFSTIALVDRRYIEEDSGVMDMPRRVFAPYKHNYVDTEFYYTACARGVFRESTRACVYHKHPDWGFAEMDETYAKSQSTLSEDGNMFNERSHLWMI